MKRKGQSLAVPISGYQKKGNGIGRALLDNGEEGLFEVPYTIAGEKALVTATRRRRGEYRCSLEAVEAPSLERVTPRCAHFQVCGGCQWQHISYEEQLRIKEGFIRESFGPLLTDKVELRPIIPCSSAWRYRNKMEFTFSQDAKGEKFLGLIMHASRGKVVNLGECHLVNYWFSEALDEVRHWWQTSDIDSYFHSNNCGSLRTLTLREAAKSGDRMAILTVSGNPDYALNSQQLSSFVAALRARIEPRGKEMGRLSIFLRIQQIAKGMPTNFYEMLLYGPDHLREQVEIVIDAENFSRRLFFHVSPMAFYQPNSYQVEKLYSTALELAHIAPDEVVYDLYCGTGTLGICAAAKARQVIGIEVCSEAALNARSNAALNGFDNVTILSGAVDHFVPLIAKSGEYPLPDLLFLDPPRSGLESNALDHIIALNPKRIVYVACNPWTQAENVAKFISSGYRLELVQPVDQFAHTPHLENIVTLNREYPKQPS